LERRHIEEPVKEIVAEPKECAGRLVVATLVRLKKVSWTMEEGLITKWLKREGAGVSEGEGICEVETEKTTDEIEAPASGILLKIVHKEGTAVPVNAVIAVIGAPGEDISSIPELGGSSPVAAHLPTATARAELAHPLPAVSKLSESSLERIRISPSARRLARERGVDIAKIRGTGPGGRIISEDVLEITGKRGAGPPAEEYKSAPLAGHRKVIADRLSLSARTAVHVPITMEIDMTPAERLKSEKEKTGLQVSYNDFTIRATAMALKEFPAVNTMLLGQELRTMNEVNVGFAVVSGDDLLVPVIRNADRLSLEDISRSAKMLAERARSGSLTTREMSGGTFTVSNLGMYDVGLFAPVINPPETAILGIGRAMPKPIVRGESIAIRQMMTLTLVFDHRVIDGVLAAKFLQRIKQLLEAPEKLTT
jgi:pyruvate dehydrogenase E2 component (dihydrolipoamide acetyltransferase)